MKRGHARGANYVENTKDGSCLLLPSHPYFAWIIFDHHTGIRVTGVPWIAVIARRKAKDRIVCSEYK